MLDKVIIFNNLEFYEFLEDNSVKMPLNKKGFGSGRLRGSLEWC